MSQIALAGICWLAFFAAANAFSAIGLKRMGPEK